MEPRIPLSHLTAPPDPDRRFRLMEIVRRAFASDGTADAPKKRTSTGFAGSSCSTSGDIRVSWPRRTFGDS